MNSWYAAKCIWKAARARRVQITTGLKSNHWLRVPDLETPRGWRWQRRAEYAVGLSDADFQALPWPSQGEELRQVWVHVIQTRVRKLYRCQVVIVRTALDTPLAETRYWASSELVADATTLLGQIATRWEIEVLFADAKDLLGLDQYQVMSATAIVRFWTLVLATYAFLDEERARLRHAWQRHVTGGEARREAQRMHWGHLITRMHQQFQAGATRTPSLSAWPRGSSKMCNDSMVKDNVFQLKTHNS